MKLRRTFIAASFLAIQVGAYSADAQPRDEVLIKAEQAWNAGNKAVAIELWASLAEGGDPMVQEWLGDLYRKGDGVRRDHKVALRWYELSARSEYLEGICSLARLLSTSSRSDVRNGTLAVRWGRRCVSQADLAETRNILALALAEAGEFEAALVEQQIALDRFRVGKYVRGGDLTEHEKVFEEQRASFLAKKAWHSEI